MTESVMVMIPLLITFLSVLQISTGVMARTVSSNVVQGAVATAAINPTILEPTSPSSLTATTGMDSQVELSTQKFDLPGGGTFTIGSQTIHKPAVSPLLPGGDNFETTGLAITE